MKMETMLGKNLYSLKQDKNILFVFSSLINTAVLCNEFGVNYIKT